MEEVRMDPPSVAAPSSPRKRSLMYERTNGLSSSAKTVWIGGPNTILPFWLESLLSWMLAISCLGVALYHWIQQLFGGSMLTWLLPPIFSKRRQQQPQRRPILPLMTHSRYEIIHTSGLERYQQLIRYLESTTTHDATTKPSANIDEWKDSDWIHFLRNDSTARRLVSLIRLGQADIPPTLQQLPLLGRVERIWPELLRLPILPDAHAYPFEMSIVTIAYKEDGRDLLTKLLQALKTAAHPESIELILVNAGHCRGDVEDLISSLASSSTTVRGFAQVTTIKGTGGGRGPSLNQGAAHAQGRILTFLHADTRLSQGWDTEVRQAFETSNTKTKLQPTTTTACAFSFAIDTTPQGLNGGPFPPGIHAIETTANWRTHLFHLPYGDQCLSIPQVYFHYLGGYPHQCLMEDYELVRLLRHRIADSSSSSTSSSGSGSIRSKESLAILPSFAYCGPRRWQTFGVLYVTYMNSRCVNLYAMGKLTPDDLFQIYYGVPANSPTAAERKSPWEVELQRVLSKNKNRHYPHSST